MYEYLSENPDQDAVEISRETQRLFDLTTDLQRKVHISPKTSADLEWGGVVELVALKTITPEGEELAQLLGPLPSLPLSKARLTHVAECLELLANEDDIPLRGVSRIRDAVAYSAREGVLNAPDLEAIAKTCDVASRTRRYLRHRAELAPGLNQLVAGVESTRATRPTRGLDGCRDLRDALQYAVEPGGRLSDDASPDLRRLRREVQNQTERIKARVEKLLRTYEEDHLLQDDYFTVREERYVLPLRVSAKRQVDGIIHGYSGSGQTAFVEPQELIELNNQLRWAQIEVQEEEHRILQRLSRLVAENADALIHNVWIIGYLDLIRAIARLSTELDATIPELSEGLLDVRRARHPLLYIKLRARGEETIPNDVRMDPEQRVLIVSGPNTGGKTVLLKTLGVCALMAQSGMPIPADEGTQIPFFNAVYSDIGDEQSIERDLSTFSGHLTNITEFLDSCDENTLVLLDELFAGTDPQQGAALAVALLEEFARRKTRTFISTHLEGLKTLALEDGAFVNASMGFDVRTLRPTYEMTLGVPGSSFALRIAARLGFPEHLVQRASAVLEGEGTLGVDQVLAQLEDQATQLKKEQRRYEQLRGEAEKIRDKFQTKFQELKSKERELLHDESRALKKQLDEARNTIKTHLKTLRDTSITRKDVDEAQRALLAAEKNVDTIKDKTRAPSADASGYVPIPMEDIEEGKHVFVSSFNRPGVILAKPTANHEVQVQVGAIKLMAQANDLYYPSDAARKTRSPEQRTTTPEAPRNPVFVQTSANTLDLRGMRVEEAVERTDLFLDAMLMQGDSGALIIHGHGTGALKRAIRDYLATSNYVREYRRGEREEGGDGVTVALLGDR